MSPIRGVREEKMLTIKKFFVLPPQSDFASIWMCYPLTFLNKEYVIIL